MELIFIVVISIIVGFVVGIFSGMLGIGGGTILIPVFKLGYSMASIASTATSLFTIAPTSISGAISHIRHKTCVPKLGVAIGIGGAVTSSLGVWLASVSPSWLIMIVAACIIVYSAVTILRRAFALPSDKTRNHREGDSTDISKQEMPSVPNMTTSQLVIGFCIGLIAGVGAGYAGVGGGFLIVPLAMQLINIPMKLTSGTSLVAMMILVIPGVVYQAILGNVNWLAGIAVACGTIPGAMVGARLIPYIPERTLRFIFGAFLLVAAIALVINQFGAFG